MKKIIAFLALLPAALFGLPQNIQKDAGALTQSFTVPTGISISATGTGTISATSVTGLSVAAGKTLTVSNSLTLAGTDGRTMTFPATNATIARTDAAQTFTGTQTFGALIASTLNGNTFTTGTGTLTIAAGKTLTASNTMTFTGTDGTSFALPSTSASIARTDAGQTFTGTQTFGAVVATTINGNAFTTGTGTLTIAAAKTLTASNTLTFTGTDGSSVAFGTGGTVLYSGGAGFVSSIAGTANQISASASTGAVTLSLAGPHAFTTLTSTALLLGAGTSPISASDITYSTPTLTVPASFAITGAGALAFNAGGSNNGFTFTPTGTGYALFNRTGGSSLSGSSNVIAVFHATTAHNLWFRYNGTGAEIDAANDSFGAYTAFSINGSTLTLNAGNSAAVLVGTSTDDGVHRFQVSGGGLFSASTQFGSAVASALILVGTGTDSSNGQLQLGASTSSARGIGFGTDASLYRSAAGTLTVGTSTNGGGLTISSSTTNGNVTASSAGNARIILVDTTATTNEKNFGFQTASSSLIFGIWPDNFASLSPAFTINRSGSTVSSFVISNNSATSVTIAGGAAATITGGAGNMTITAGTGNSRTLALQTTTSGGVATTALTLGADQSATLVGQLVDSFTSIASTPASTFTGSWFTGGSATTTKPHLLVEPSGTTSNNWATTGTGFGINAASGFTGRLMELQVAATSVLIVANTGIITATVTPTSGQVANFLMPSLGTTPDTVDLYIGANKSTWNAAAISFKYVASGSSSNSLEIGYAGIGFKYHFSGTTFSSDNPITTASTITTLGGATFHTTSSALTNGAGVQVGTLTTAPAAGNPTKWIGINDNGTTRYVPAW